MAHLKSYTSLNQSKVLAKILPLESADMSWVSCDDGKQQYYSAENRKIVLNYEKKHWIPCWSLVALLGVLPKEIPHKDAKYVEDRKDWTYCWLLTPKCLFYKCTILLENGGRYDDVFAEVYHQGNPVDACYVMILMLHELNLL